MGSRGRQASLLRAFFGQPTTGRLARLPFLGFWLLLWVLFVLYGTGIAFGIGVAEPLIFEGPVAVRDELLGRPGPPVLALMGLCCLLFVGAQLNLLTKRIRDMGLPAWSVLLVIALLATGLAAALALPAGGPASDQGSRFDGTYQGLLLLALFLIPSGLFGRAAASTSVDGPVGKDAPVGGGPTDVPPPEPSPVATPAGASERGRMDQDLAGGVRAE